MLQILTFTKVKNNFLIAKSINILLTVCPEKKLVCVVCLFNIFLLKNICNKKVE